MALFRKIDDFRNKTVILVLFDLFFLILPGMAVIYFVKPELLVSLDWIKLILLSATITAPFVISNSLALAILEGNKAQTQNKEDEFFMIFTLATFITGFVIYILLGVHYFFHSSLHYLVIFGTLLEMLLFVKALWVDRKNFNK